LSLSLSVSLTLALSLTLSLSLTQTCSLSFFLPYMCSSHLSHPLLSQDREQMTSGIYSTKWFLQCFIDRVSRAVCLGQWVYACLCVSLSLSLSVSLCVCVCVCVCVRVRVF